MSLRYLCPPVGAVGVYELAAAVAYAGAPLPGITFRRKVLGDWLLVGLEAQV